MLNIRYLAGHSVTPLDDPRAHLQLAAEIAGLHFYRIPDTLPRFYLVPSVHVSRGLDETFSYLARPDFDPAHEAVVEANELPPPGPLGNGAVTVERYSANQVALKIVADARSFLASSEPLYPGWTAPVNGQPVRLYMTNGAFRGIWLKPGVNQVMMTYWPQGFLIWAAVSVASLALVSAGLVLGGSRVK